MKIYPNGLCINNYQVGQSLKLTRARMIHVTGNLRQVLTYKAGFPRAWSSY